LWGGGYKIWVQIFIIIIIITNAEISRKINLEEGFFFLVFKKESEEYFGIGKNILVPKWNIQN